MSAVVLLEIFGINFEGFSVSLKKTFLEYPTQNALLRLEIDKRRRDRRLSSTNVDGGDKRRRRLNDRHLSMVSITSSASECCLLISS